MHRFTELVDRCIALALGNMQADRNRVLEQLQSSGATPLVKALQMITLQKSIMAVGAFAMFDAVLQDALNGKDGFEKAISILSESNKELCDKFEIMSAAVNVLKHGHGRSYKFLVSRSQQQALPFRLLMPNENFFNEGDVDEINTLIYVDDAFVQLCADVISQVSEVLKLKAIGV